ncbi:MAG TPA: substrate-binding domain-containing protein [Thermoplasmata archaeon]|nr:substrate-binding domain-containing protein [Thermoplasmata archaeon]
MHFRVQWRWFALATAAALALLAVGAYLSAPRSYLFLATTTSTRDTGLLPYLLPSFTADTGIDVRYTAVGTGQALDYGRRGDADVVMVHAPSLETAFLAEGQGLCKNLIMYNTFVIVGPIADPAGIRNATSATDAFRRIHDTASRFESRADNSGTYNKEIELWRNASLNASTFGAWYEKTDQGMGATLTIANERDAYTLSDDGTWYALEAHLPYLRLEYDRSETILRNQYSVIPVNPNLHPSVHVEQAVAFARWLVSPRGQDLIAAYTVNGHRIFTPDGTGAC